MTGNIKGTRSKGQEIQASSDPNNADVININDIILPPISYIKAVKTVNFHTKHSSASEDRSILHPQVNKGFKGLDNKLSGLGDLKRETIEH